MDIGVRKEKLTVQFHRRATVLGPSYCWAGHFTDTVTLVEPIEGAGYTALPGKFPILKIPMNLTKSHAYLHELKHCKVVISL